MNSFWKVFSLAQPFRAGEGRGQKYGWAFRPFALDIQDKPKGLKPQSQQFFCHAPQP
jgi:hypothetical protein